MRNIGSNPFHGRPVYSGDEPGNPEHSSFDEEYDRTPSMSSRLKEGVCNAYRGVKNYFFKGADRRYGYDVEETRRFTVRFPNLREIVDGLRNMFNTCKTWCQFQIRRIIGRYEEGTPECRMVKRWDTFYKDFQSDKTQAELAKVPGENKKGRIPVLVADYMKEINSFIHDMKKEELSTGRKMITGCTRDFLCNMIDVVPVEIVRRFKRGSGNRHKNIGDGAMAQFSMLVDTLKYIKELSATKEDDKRANACDAISIMIMAFCVSNEGVEVADKKIATETFLNMMDKLHIANTKLRNHDNKFVKEMGAFVQMMRTHIMKHRGKLTVRNTIMDMLRKKHNIAPTCPPYRACGVFLLNLLAKSGIISYKGCSSLDDFAADLEKWIELLSGKEVPLPASEQLKLSNEDILVLDKCFAQGNNFANNFA